MGFGGISPGSLIVILLIVVVMFGSKRIRNLGRDLGSGVRGFREGMKNEDIESLDDKKE